jgi:phosphoribosylanthranilate isomerase
MTTLLKVCGATTDADVDVLHAAGADLVGLWHGVSGGRAELGRDHLASLAAACRLTGSLDPVLVTFLRDPDDIVAAARHAGIRWLQLHGYQAPAVVGAVKRSLPEAMVVKVLHVEGADCVERPLLGSYERAGVDLFLLDAAEGGHVGSTGRTLDAEVVAALVERTSVPFMLAGGISADARPRYDDIAAHVRFAGIDVDTGARDGTGEFDYHSIHAIRRHWSVTERVPARVVAGVAEREGAA